jgi:hypothetical protein
MHALQRIAAARPRYHPEVEPDLLSPFTCIPKALLLRADDVIQ